MVSTRGGPLLPPEGVGRPLRFLTLGSVSHQVAKGIAVLLAGAFLFAGLFVLPRPDIILTNPQYFPGECDPENETRILTATFTLTNRGSGSGAMEVRLYADHITLSSDVLFEVPPRSSIRGTLSGIVHDCAQHTYSLSATHPSSGA